MNRLQPPSILQLRDLPPASGLSVLEFARTEGITRMQSVAVGDRVQMKKPHPCGSDQWIVYRIGADIGLRCAGCGRQVMLARAVFNKRLKKIVSSSTDKDTG